MCVCMVAGKHSHHGSHRVVQCKGRGSHSQGFGMLGVKIQPTCTTKPVCSVVLPAEHTKPSPVGCVLNAPGYRSLPKASHPQGYKTRRDALMLAQSILAILFPDQAGSKDFRPLL